MHNNNDDTTYYESFLASVELLPNDIRRDFELMKELDREANEFNKELIQLETDYIAKVKKLKQFGSLSEIKMLSMDDINNLRVKIKQRLAEKSAIAKNLSNDIEKFTRKLDTDIISFENELRSGGKDFEVGYRGPEVGAEVAVKTSFNCNDSSIILGRVTSYSAETGMYDISDYDDENKLYKVFQTQVIILEVDATRRIAKGEYVYAMYPDTTSFYPAVVIKSSNKGINSTETSCIVQFVGDADENGFTPTLTVLTRYVIRTPPSWTY